MDSACLPLLILLLQAAVAARGEQAAPALRDQIDGMIEEAAEQGGVATSSLADDAAFLRRVTLDLSGGIPQVEEARRFLADDHADKRERLVDRLLESPQHARRMQYVLDVMLMSRLSAKHVEQGAWREFLYQSVRDNKPWDVLAVELLAADGSTAENRPAARFLLDRELKPEATTRAIGRVFLGRDLQCAQCHDHPQLDDYLQRHYYGIAAFLSRSYLFKDPKSKLTTIGEKAEGAVEFTSVFTGVTDNTAPRMLDLPAIEDPAPDKEPYVAKPDKGTRGVPKYSRRRLLAAAVTDPGNRAFRLNIANRLWALLMGRGLIEPVDMMHADAKASHPQLLDLLADDLHDHGYDMRRTIREIALSRSYQRSSRYVGGETPTSSHAAGPLKPLTPEQFAWSTMEAVGVAAAARQSSFEQLVKKQPELAPESADFARQWEQATEQALRKHVDEFVDVFASGNESSRFDATAQQALFLKNGTRLTEWLQPAPGSLVDRLQRQGDDLDGLAEEAYLSVLTRQPSAAEVASVKEFLEAFGPQRLEALQTLVRATLCSAEFRFNH